MRKGLYGKLPAKRDFVAVSATREFLLKWEAWLQGGLSASMMTLGPAWRDAYLKAPIWRFWLGHKICGEPVIGAFMPSLDGVGRYFPLSAFVRATDGVVLPPPEFEPQTSWFSAIENLLLSALEEGTSLEALTAALEALADPSDRVPPFAKREALSLTDGSLVIEAGQNAFADVFTSARLAGHASSYADQSFWWTAGGEGFPAVALARRGLPDPLVYTGMLTGDFKSMAASRSGAPAP